MRLSITVKIFASFMVLLILFGGVSLYSLLRMHDAQEDLRVLNRVYLRLNEAYLQLNLLITEVHTYQNNVVNYLDSTSEGRNPLLVARWIGMARTYRLKRISQAIHVAERAMATIGMPGADRRFIQKILKSLFLLKEKYEDTENLYKQLFQEEGKKKGPLPDRVQVTGLGLTRRERDAFSILRKLNTVLRRRLSNNLVPTVIRAAGRIERTENRAFYATMTWVVLAMIVGLLITWMSHMTLRPLRRLADGARRIGRGEYEPSLEINSSDEVGTLATEFNAMTAALKEREQRLIETERLAARAERLAAMGQLAAQITHEIRNPLSSIGLNAEILEEELVREDAPSQEARELLAKIQMEVDRLAEITEEYLTFARLPRPRIEPENVCDVVQGVIDLVKGEYQAAGMEISLSMEDDLPQVLMDENQIRQAVLNLLRNSMEAMLQVRKTGRVTVRVGLAHPGPISSDSKEKAHHVEIRIADDGPGIKEERLHQIFEPFYSTKEKGTGLGLAITQQIIAEHHGSITVGNDPGQGAVFTITLPISS